MFWVYFENVRVIFDTTLQLFVPDLGSCVGVCIVARGHRSLYYSSQTVQGAPVSSSHYIANGRRCAAH